MSRFALRGLQLVLIAVCSLLTVTCSSTGRRIKNASPAGIEDKTFRLVPAYIVSVNVPCAAAEKVMNSVTDSVPLKYGNYDHVAFRSATGVEQFRPLQGSRAGEQPGLSEVPTYRITFAIPEDDDILHKVVAAVRYAHPYEEPVLHVEAGWMSQANHGGEESNPNRWWNNPKGSSERGAGPP
jgi:hypothetical protein